MVSALGSLAGSRAEARRVAAIAMADPIGCGPEVAALIDEASAATPLDARSAFFLAMAGHSIGAYEASLPLFATASDRLREQGRLSCCSRRRS